MSNTPSSRPAAERRTQHGVVDELVASRMGRRWCLFLDRDGVINRQIVGDYVRTLADFEWLPDVRPALSVLRSWAPYLVVVTNQQGVGKGLMTWADVSAIHQYVRDELSAWDVAIDDVRVCPHLEAARCACRKPHPGLVVDWLAAHPEVDSAYSVVVGDSQSDLALARNVADVTGGCASIQIGDRAQGSVIADATFGALWDFATAVGRTREEHGW